MDALFEAYLGIYEENELEKRGRKNKEALDTGFMKLSPEEREQESARIDNLAKRASQNEEFVPLSPEKEKRVQNRVGELVRNIQVKGERVRELKKQPFKRFRPKLRAEIQSIAKSGKKEANLARNATDALIRTSVDREASSRKKVYDLKNKLADLEGRNNIRKFTREELEYILDVLVNDGYVDDYENAVDIMEAMSEEWLEEILMESPWDIIHHGSTIDGTKIMAPTHIV